MSFRGLIGEIPVGIDGLTGSKNPSQILPGQLVQARNVTYEAFTVRKEAGAIKYNSVAISGAPRVLAGWDWWPWPGVQQMVVYTSDSRILMDDGSQSFSVTLRSGLTPLTQLNVPMFCEGGSEVLNARRKLFACDGLNPVVVKSGSDPAMVPIAKPPSDWIGRSQPTFLVSHQGRIWGGGNANNPFIIYSSRPDDHENYDTSTSTAVFLPVYPGEGERLVGALSFKKLLVIFKYPRGVYIVDTTSPSIADWRTTRISFSIGGVTPLGTVMIDDDVLLLDPGCNIQQLSTIVEYGNLGSHSLSQASFMGPFFRDNVNLAGLGLAQSVYYSAKREAIFAVPSLGSIYPNRRVTVDFNRSDLARFRWSDRDDCTSIWLRKDVQGVFRPTYGDSTGTVWLMDQEVRSLNGAAYTGLFQMPATDFSYIDPRLASLRKKGMYLQLVIEPRGAWNISVDVYWDGKYYETLTFTVGTNPSNLDTFILDTNTLSGDVVLTGKKRLRGGGRRLSLIIYNSDAGGDFSVARAIVGFKAGDERT